MFSFHSSEIGVLKLHHPPLSVLPSVKYSLIQESGSAAQTAAQGIIEKIIQLAEPGSRYILNNFYQHRKKKTQNNNLKGFPGSV